MISTLQKELISQSQKHIAEREELITKIYRMEQLLNPKQIASCQPEQAKAPGPPTIVDMANEISDDSTVSVMTGESVGKTAATYDSKSTQSLAQVVENLQDSDQLVSIAEQPEAPPMPPIIPVTVKPREPTILESILNHPDNSPQWRLTPVRVPTPPPVIHAPVPRKAPQLRHPQIRRPKRRRAHQTVMGPLNDHRLRRSQMCP